MVRKLTGTYYGAEFERFVRTYLFVTLCLRPARVVGCIAVSRLAPRNPSIIITTPAGAARAAI